MSLSKQLDGFELKLRQLASQFERQRAENEEMVTENKKLKSELDRQRGVVTSLKMKLEKTTAAVSVPVGEPNEEGSSPEVSKADLRRELDHCLGEIDKCIDWLQQQ